jgi:hypothetical protein
MLKYKCQKEDNIMDKEMDIWQKIEDYGIATYEEIDLVTSINGLSIDTLNDIIYARTGYRDMDQYEEEIN